MSKRAASTTNFFEMTKLMAQALSLRAFVCAAICFSLLVWASAASALPRKVGPSRIIASAVPHEAPIATSANDSGAGSLRQALVDAQDGDTITFNIPPPAPSGRTAITLTSGELIVDKNITIIGPGANMLEVRRDSTALPFRIFTITAGHTVTIQGLTISNGNATAGGGIYNDHSFVTVDLCDVTGNSASGATFGGGGIYNDGSNGANATLVVTHSLVRGNSAPNGFGGGIASSGLNGGSATLNVVNSTLIDNSASPGGGGAIHQDTAGGGGNAFLTIASSTISGNSGAAGIYSLLSSLQISNTILKTGNTGPNILTSAGAASSAGYNLSDDNGNGLLTAAGDQTNTDPMLGPLKDNGGPTLTCAPLVSSPAVDQGKSMVVNDQRTFVRPVDDASVPNASGGNGSDIGAVELAQGVHPSRADSFKTHGDAGTFAINLPLSGLGIECRSGGADSNYQIVVTFPEPVTFSGASVTGGVGMISNLLSEPHSFDNGKVGTQLTVDLAGVADDQVITVALFDVDDGTSHSDVGVHMGVLVGDVNDGGNVSSSDISQVKLHSGLSVNADNFRADVIANGVINASDISATRAKSGTALP